MRSRKDGQRRWGKWVACLWLVLPICLVFWGCAITVDQVKKWEKDRAAEPLIEALKDQNAAVRKAAAEALGKIGDARAVEPLISVLDEQNSGIQQAAIKALGKIGDVRAVEPLIAKLEEERKLTLEKINIQKAAADALGEIGGARAVDSLIAILSLEVRRVMGAVVEINYQYGRMWGLMPNWTGGSTTGIIQGEIVWYLGRGVTIDIGKGVTDPAVNKLFEQYAQDVSSATSRLRQSAEEALAKIRGK